MTKKFLDGLAQAQALLAKLTPNEREKIIENIKKEDPNRAIELEKGLVRMEDLKFITPKMMANLLKDVDSGDFALALRGVNKEVIDHVLSLVSESIRAGFNEILRGPPQSMDKVNEAQTKILDIVRAKVKKGELVLSDDKDLYV